MSDGAAGVVVMSAEKAAQFGIEAAGKVRFICRRRRPPELMGIGPIVAFPRH